MVVINGILKSSAGITLIICYLGLLTDFYCAETGSSWRGAHINKKIKDKFNTKSGACSDKENQKSPDWSSVLFKNQI